jgi:hypothetical protein
MHVALGIAASLRPRRAKAELQQSRQTRRRGRSSSTTGHNRCSTVDFSVVPITDTSSAISSTTEIALLDYFVGAQQYRLRYVDAERFGCFEIDDEEEFSRLLEGNFARVDSP